MNIQHLPTQLADAARHTAEGLGHALEEGRDVSVASASSALDATSARLRTLATVVASYASLRTLAGAVDTLAPGRHLLDLVGLQRRPSMVSRVAVGAGLVAAGVAVGAGVALLVAPRSGAQLRERMKRALWTLRHDAEGVAHDVEGAVERAAHSVKVAVAHADHQPAMKTEPGKVDGASHASTDATRSAH